MNTQIMLSRILQAIVDAPVWSLLLMKITAILGLAWLVHLALFGANPRWRVLLWRMTAAGLIALPAIVWLFPAMQIRFIPSPENKTTANQGGSSQNIALTNPTLAESLKNDPTGESGKRLLRTDSKRLHTIPVEWMRLSRPGPVRLNLRRYNLHRYARGLTQYRCKICYWPFGWAEFSYLHCVRA